MNVNLFLNFAYTTLDLLSQYFDEIVATETSRDGGSTRGDDEEEEGGVIGLRELYKKMRVYLSWLISLVVDIVSISLSTLALQMVRKRAEVRL